MKEEELVKTMHYYFNAVIKLRQNLKQRVQKVLLEQGYSEITLEMTQVLYFLRFVANEGVANQQEIADNLGKNKSSVTSLINNLVIREMIVRQLNPKNRRNNIITLSEKGHQFIKDVYPKVYSTYDISKFNLELADIQNLTVILNQLIDS